MSTLTTEANHIASRGHSVAALMPSIQRTIDADLAAALHGTATSERHGPPRVADDGEDEPPTGHHDPTGDIAISGAVAGVKRRSTRIMDALYDIDRAFDHLQRVITAEIGKTTPPTEIKPSDLCANTQTCSKLKAAGSEWCDACGLERDRHARANAPRCYTCTERPVESYQTRHGLAFRRMELTADGWQAKQDGAPPQCEPCRRADERRGVILEPEGAKEMTERIGQ